MAEFVAFFAGVLRGHRVVLGEGAGGKEEVERGLRCRCAGSPISLAMGGDVEVRLVGR